MNNERIQEIRERHADAQRELEEMDMPEIPKEHQDRAYLLSEVERLQKQITAVNQELIDGPQPFMTADDWRDWLFSVLPFLEEGDKE
jgi:hypothetical protein